MSLPSFDNCYKWYGHRHQRQTDSNFQRFLVFVSIQAEPLVIDLKDLFQVIFNLRKKEAEGTQKVMEAEAFNFRLEKIFSK